MAHFQLADGTPISEICLDSAPRPDGVQKKIILEQWGWDEDANPHEIAFTNSSLIKVTVLSNTRKTHTTRFLIEAAPRASGTAQVLARLAQDQKKTGKARGIENSQRLDVRVGVVTNHHQMQVDLFAELLGRSEDPVKLNVYRRALDFRNNDVPSGRDTWDARLANQPLKQIVAPASAQNCGGALRQFGARYFGAIHLDETTLYYERPRTTNRADVKINPTRMKKGVDAIIAKLNRKIPVRVFALHADGFSIVNGVIQATGITHYLTIIGHNGGTRFLVVDPWPGGSQLEYTSGIFGTAHSSFMGILKYEFDRLQTPVGGQVGAHNYLVLAGP